MLSFLGLVVVCAAFIVAKFYLMHLGHTEGAGWPQICANVGRSLGREERRARASGLLRVYGRLQLLFDLLSNSDIVGNAKAVYSRCSTAFLHARRVGRRAAAGTAFRLG